MRCKSLDPGRVVPSRTCGANDQSKSTPFRPYKCNICDATFTRLVDLGKHVLALHEVLCPRCGETYRDQRSLKGHVCKAHPNREPEAEKLDGQENAPPAIPEADIPEPPMSSFQPIRSTCTCDDCRNLNNFLTDLQQPVFIIRAAKRRRRHVERFLPPNRQVLTWDTIKDGLPHQLRITFRGRDAEEVAPPHRAVQPTAEIQLLTNRFRPILPKPASREDPLPAPPQVCTYISKHQLGVYF